MFKAFARWILKKEIKALKEEAKTPEVYVDCDDSDRITFWKDILRWSDAKEARAWAFKEINSLLNELVVVGPNDSHKFWSIQGALEQMHRFIVLPKIINEKLNSIEAEFKTKKEDGTEEPESISTQFS